MNYLIEKLIPLHINTPIPIRIYLSLLCISTVVIPFLVKKQRSKNKEIREYKSYNKITVCLNWITTFNLVL